MNLKLFYNKILLIRNHLFLSEMSIYELHMYLYKNTESSGNLKILSFNHFPFEGYFYKDTFILKRFTNIVSRNPISRIYGEFKKDNNNPDNTIISITFRFPFIFLLYLYIIIFMSISSIILIGYFYLQKYFNILNIIKIDDNLINTSIFILPIFCIQIIYTYIQYELEYNRSIGRFINFIPKTVFIR
jgi:hypothetical protein